MNRSRYPFSSLRIGFSAFVLPDTKRYVRRYTRSGRNALRSKYQRPSICNEKPLTCLVALKPTDGHFAHKSYSCLSIVSNAILL